VPCTRRGIKLTDNFFSRQGAETAKGREIMDADERGGTRRKPQITLISTNGSLSRGGMRGFIKPQINTVGPQMVKNDVPWPAQIEICA
jgi:hypothetical protein